MAAIGACRCSTSGSPFAACCDGIALIHQACMPQVADGRVSLGFQWGDEGSLAVAVEDAGAGSNGAVHDRAAEAAEAPQAGPVCC